MSKKSVNSKRLKYIKSQQKWARDFVKDAESKGYIIAPEVKKALTVDKIYSKVQYESLKKTLTQHHIKATTEYAIPKLYKSKSQREYTERPLKEDLNALGINVSSGIKYETMEKIKDKKISEKEMADILNDLISEQRSSFLSVDNQLAKAVWDIAYKMNGNKDPNVPSTSAYELEQVMSNVYVRDKDGKVVKDADGKPVMTKDFVDYRFKDVTLNISEMSQPEKEQMYREFYQSVKFTRVDPDQWSTIRDIIMAHPQTNKRLYKLYQDLAGKSSSATNAKNLIASGKLNLPTSTVSTLLDLMETSDVWHIAKRGTYDSEQVLENWQHIFQDLATLEQLPEDDNIKELRQDIMNGANINVEDVANKTKEALDNYEMEYRNKMSYHYEIRQKE